LIVRKAGDHVVKATPYGEVREVLRGDDYAALTLAVVLNARPSGAHYHQTFDEIYLLLDGSLTVRFHDPTTEQTWEESLNANEVCVITKGIHYRITQASDRNRLCAIAIPRYDPADDLVSESL